MIRVWILFFALQLIIPLSARSSCEGAFYRLSSAEFQGQAFPHLLHSSLPVGREVALFPAGSHQAVLQLEEELRQQGVAAIVLRSPTPEDLQALTEGRGYFHGPNWTSWHRPTPSLAELEGAVESEEIDSDYRRKLKKSADFVTTVEELTPQNYAEFFELYEKTTIERNNGTRTIQANHLEADGATKGLFDNWRLVRVRDPQSSQRLVGGLLIEIFPNLIVDGRKGVAKIKTAAYLRGVPNARGEDYGRLQLSHRAQHEYKIFAAQQGLQTLSYGSDPNFYGSGAGANTGLPGYKFVSGFTPTLATIYPGEVGKAFGTDRVIKVLRPEVFSDPTAGPQFFFFKFAADGSLRPHFQGDFSDHPLQKLKL